MFSFNEMGINNVKEIKITLSKVGEVKSDKKVTIKAYQEFNPCEYLKVLYFLILIILIFR